MVDETHIDRRSAGDSRYAQLVAAISKRYRQGQAQAIRAVNEAIIDTYWSIGSYIVEYEQRAIPSHNMARSFSTLFQKT